MATAAQIMEEYAMSESMPKSVLRKRKRSQDKLETLGTALLDAERELAMKIVPCPEDPIPAPEHPLEDHPDFNFLFQVAGTDPTLTVFDMVRTSYRSDTSKKLDEISDTCQAAHTVLLEMIGKLGQTVDFARDLSDDDAIALQIHGILTGSPDMRTEFLEKLQVARDVRAYLAGSGSVKAERERLIEEIEKHFGTKLEGKDEDMLLSQWLISNGPILMRRVSPELQIGVAEDETGEESMLSQAEKKPRGRGSPQVFSADASYYVDLDDLEQRIDSVANSTTGMQRLQQLMQDFDEGYITPRPEDGAWDWLTTREKEVRRVNAELQAQIKDVRAARDAFNSAKLRVINLRETVKNAQNIHPDKPIPLTEEVTMAIRKARTYIAATNPEGYARVTEKALMRAEPTVSTTFAYMTGLLLLRTRLQYPDRYRPVITDQRIEVELKNSAVILAGYEFYGSRVVPIRT